MAARSNSPATEQAQTLLPVDMSREKHHISAGVFAGACGVNGWKPGRQMTETEFLAGIDRFMNAPMGAEEVAQ